MASGLLPTTPFPPFSPYDSAPATRWALWKSRLENFLIGYNITDAGRKTALLLHFMGEETHKIFLSLELETVGEAPAPRDTYIQALRALDNYFIGEKNMEYEVYNFRQARQKNDESIDAYHTRLRGLAEHCEFHDAAREIKSHIIVSCTSTRLRRRALREKMTLEELLNLARAYELSDKQASDIERSPSEPESVQALQGEGRQECVQPPQEEEANYTAPRRGRGRRGNSNRDRNTQPASRDIFQGNRKSTACYRCGGAYPHSGPCPATGETCSKCGKGGHFARVCRSRVPRARAVEEETDSGDEYAFSATAGRRKRPKLYITVGQDSVEMLVDTGTTVNIIDYTTFSKLRSPPELQGATTRIRPYGKAKPLGVKGIFETSLEYKGERTRAKVFVVKGSYGSLLSYDTAVDLGIIAPIRAIEFAPSTKTEKILQEFEDRFTGIGCIKGVEAKIHIDSNMQPVAQPHRRIPFHMRKKLEVELQRLEELDIIEKVHGPTPWVSPIVVAPKPKAPEEIRICVDMRVPNQAVKRERHVTPTIDDIIVDLNGACVFSKLDLNAGYHQVKLDPKSRDITTFTTHVGLRRYKRLIFGISSAAEMFQTIVRDCLNGLEGVRNISDDIIIFAKDQESHDRRLRECLQRLREKNITLNKAKCKFNKSEVDFFGYIFSKQGMRPDPEKVKAVKDAERPTTPAEIRSLLGLANYVSRFIPDFATIAAPLRLLTHKDVEWKWTNTEEKALQAIKDKLTTTAMAYFDPRKKTELIVDASPVGLGAVLCQEGKVLQYASKSLSDVEGRYSQIEKEALAIVWGCEHFHLYLYGAHFVLHTDHKPLETIFNNPRSRPSARIERWRLRLQPYEFTVKYLRGAGNPADYMSRHPVGCGSTRHSKVAEEYLSFIVENTTPKAMTIQEIAEETARDTVLQEVISRVVTGRWSNMEMESPGSQAFTRVRDELTVAPTEGGSVLLHLTRLVIPESLQQKVVNLAHEGHMGMTKTKQLLREKVWFPGINDIVEATCKNCIPCLAATPTNNVEPLRMTELPERPWANVSCDFMGPLPSGDYILAVIDDYSRFPVVEIVTSTSAKASIPRLDRIFSEYGVPEVVKSDNGPPFNGSDFKGFAEHLGFRHRKITPIWPQANGEVERFMKTMGKTIKTASVAGLSWKQEMYKFLRNYRATPHSTTKMSPAEALFGRPIRTKLPEFKIRTDKDEPLRQEDREKKIKMKMYADEKRNAREHTLQEGDHVLVRADKKLGKLSTPFSPVKYEVIDVKGPKITARSEDRVVTRNSSFFKKIGNQRGTIEVREDPDHDDLVDGNMKERARPTNEGIQVPVEMPSHPVEKDVKVPMRVPSRPVRVTHPPARYNDFILN